MKQKNLHAMGAYRFKKNHPTIKRIRELKDTLAKKKMSFEDFHKNYYLRFSDDDYGFFLEKLNYWEVWTSSMKRAFKLLERA